MADINFRSEVRLKLLKHEQYREDSNKRFEKERMRGDKLDKKCGEQENTMKLEAKAAKEDRARILAEKD